MFNVLSQSHISDYDGISFTNADDINLSDHEYLNFVDSPDISDPLFTCLQKSRFNNPKSLIITPVNVNSLKKEKNGPLDYFGILIKGFVDILCVSETNL